MFDALSQIEDSKAQQDMGAIAYRMYKGARGDGATRLEGLLVMVAWFRGLLEATSEQQLDS